MKHNFSILKWIIFPLLVAAFGSGIIYVSVQIFQWKGSIPTIGLVLVCFAISLVFVLHTSNHDVKTAMVAAFVFESLGVLALGITLICSIVVLREFSGASQTIESETKSALDKEKERTAQIKAIGELKSKTAQATIAKGVVTTGEQTAKPSITLAEVYTKAETFLLYPLIFEALVYLLGLLAVFGLVQFFGEHHDNEPEPEPEPEPTPKKQVRTTFLPRNAPLRVYTQTGQTHKVENGNGFGLSISPAGIGFAIRFHERGMLAKHVLRITSQRKETQHLETLNYQELAKWVLTEIETLGKRQDKQELFDRIKDTL